MTYASDLTHLVLVFEDNRLIGPLYGQFDQHLALIEQKLDVDATARTVGDCSAARGELQALLDPAP